MANWLYGGKIIAADELVKALAGEPYDTWEFEKPNAYPYTLATKLAHRLESHLAAGPLRGHTFRSRRGADWAQSDS